MNITATDVLDIQNLITAYCLTTDNKDADGFMNCWVEPAEFGGYDSGAFGNMKTWQELKDFEQHHVGPGGDANGKRHQATNIHITFISETEARVTNDMLVFEVAEIPFLVATGRYNDSVVVKTKVGWKFKSRTLDIDTGYFKLLETWQQKSNLVK
jgi:hypothetical protein